MQESPRAPGPTLQRLPEYHIDEAQLQHLLGQNKQYKGMLIAQGNIPIFLRLMRKTKDGESPLPISMEDDAKGLRAVATVAREQDFYAVLQTKPDPDLQEDKYPRIHLSQSSTLHTRPCVAVTLRENGEPGTDFTDCPYFQFNPEEFRHPAKTDPMAVLKKRLHLRNTTSKISLLVCRGDEMLRPRMIFPGSLSQNGGTQDKMTVIGMHPREPIAAFHIELREPQEESQMNVQAPDVLRRLFEQPGQ